jgi:hypothetical protein
MHEGLEQRKQNANARRWKGGTGIHERDNKKNQLECTKGKAGREFTKGK